MDASTIRIQRVLCAVTFSPTSRHVVAWAASMARVHDGEIRLFHAMPGSRARASAASEPDSERVLENVFALARHLPGRQRISAAVTEGDAAGEILRHARLVKTDLIAVGMHAHDGSVSPLVTRLAIDAPCPVLVVDTRPTAPTEPGALDRILVAVNFLPASRAAADYAFALARAVRAQVRVVHVLPERAEGADPLGERAVMAQSGIARDRMEVVTSGRPCVEIVRIATSRHADLIVMGIDARTQSRGEFGETTSCVMQFAGRTVLLVPERLAIGG